MKPPPVTNPASGSNTTTSTLAVPTPPSSSATVTVIVNMPAWAYVWLRLHAPSWPNLSDVPSSQLIRQVCVSWVPGSVNGAIRVTASDTGPAVHGAGEVMVMLGATLAMRTVAVSLTGGFTPSSAVRVTMNVPSS